MTGESNMFEGEKNDVSMETLLLIEKKKSEALMRIIKRIVDSRAAQDSSLITELTNAKRVEMAKTEEEVSKALY